MARRGHACRCCSAIGIALTGWGKSLDAWNLWNATASLTTTLSSTYATLFEQTYSAASNAGAIKLELAGTETATRLRVTLTTHTYADPIFLPTTQASPAYRTWTWTAVYENTTAAITSIGEITKLTFSPAMLVNATHTGDQTIAYKTWDFLGNATDKTQPSTNQAHLGTITLVAVAPIPTLAGRDATLRFTAGTDTLTTPNLSCPGQNYRYTVAGITSRTFETTLTTAEQRFTPPAETFPWINGNISDLYYYASIHNNTATNRLDAGFYGLGTYWEYSDNPNPIAGINSQPFPTPAFPCATGREVGIVPTNGTLWYLNSPTFRIQLNATLYHAIATPGPNATTILTTTVGDPDTPFNIFPDRVAVGSYGYPYGLGYNPITTTITIFPPA